MKKKKLDDSNRWCVGGLGTIRLYPFTRLIYGALSGLFEKTFFNPCS